MEQEIQQLREQLKLVTSLHERAEAKIAELINCPDKTSELRSIITDPTVGVPLLQSYDRTLAEKEQTIQLLQSEIAVLRGQLDARDTAGREAGIAARTAEQRAQLEVDGIHARTGATDALLQQLRRTISELQAELSIARDRISATLISEGHAKDEVQRLTNVVEERTNALRTAQDERSAAQSEADALRRKLVATLQSEEEGKAAVEGHKIQLHLAARENDDKVQELERLRNKMSQALKQSSENHVQHLKLVEEKHRAAIESQREEIRAQDAVVTKLRAQLARADWLHGANKTQDSAMSLVDTQTRLAQEQEIKRLYNEISALTAQRDEAMFRLEATSASRKTDLDDRLRESRRDADGLRARVREVEERLAVLQVESSRAQDEARVAKDECRTAQAERARILNEKQELVRAADQAKRAQIQAEEKAEATSQETRQQLEAEKRVVRTMERRIADLRQEDQQLRDRLTAECEEWRRQFEQTASALREQQQKMSELRTLLADKEKSAETLAVKCERLTQGLHANKSKLVALDTRLGQTSQREQQLLEDLRTAQIFLEESRLDCTKSKRDRDRMERELVTLSLQLEMLAKAAAGTHHEDHHRHHVRDLDSNTNNQKKSSSTKSSRVFSDVTNADHRQHHRPSSSSASAAVATKHPSSPNHRPHGERSSNGKKGSSSKSKIASSSKAGDNQRAEDEEEQQVAVDESSLLSSLEKQLLQEQQQQKKQQQQQQRQQTGAVSSGYTGDDDDEEE